MSKRSETPENMEALREKIIGLGESSVRKSYYPKLQQQIREMQRFRELLGQSNDSIFLMQTPSGAFADVNDTACRLLSYSRQQMLTLTLYDVADSSTLGTIDDLLKHGQAGARCIKEITLLKGFSKQIPVEISVRLADFGGSLYAIAAARDISERKMAEQRIKDSLEEKEILLRELHHRTNNNMDIIMELLGMQVRSIKDPGMKLLFKETQDRIQSIALVHKMLYETGEISNLDLKPYLEKLARYTLDSYGEKGENIRLKMDMVPVRASLYLAGYCGLIINELLANAIKFAFPGGMEGEVTISLKARGGEIEMSCSDNGVGLPEGLGINDSGTPGLKLVKNLAEKQLLGSLEIQGEKGKGTKVTIHFNKDRLK